MINCSPFLKGFDQVETVHYFSARVQWKGTIHCQARNTAANTPNTKSNRWSTLFNHPWRRSLEEVMAMAISLLFGFLIFYYAAISTVTAGKFFFHSFFLPYLIFHSVPVPLVQPWLMVFTHKGIICWKTNTAHIPRRLFWILAEIYQSI